jgi:hypothetical protein
MREVSVLRRALLFAAQRCGMLARHKTGHHLGSLADFLRHALGVSHRPWNSDVIADIGQASKRGTIAGGE